MVKVVISVVQWPNCAPIEIPAYLLPNSRRLFKLPRKATPEDVSFIRDLKVALQSNIFDGLFDIGFIKFKLLTLTQYCVDVRQLFQFDFDGQLSKPTASAAWKDTAVVTLELQEKRFLFKMLSSNSTFPPPAKINEKSYLMLSSTEEKGHR
ncbi:hypothetical protein T4D_2226 [Trichinella pseudospiralis]|uniref:Uncharacterized protein n=1 Tax=Trichinella pseudospiralis TaxID=6337 RepID=A0A0V1FR51_TRIPS|nr:hypothetical protein T4D_2226 [Trichinella pseudospiralis]